MYDLYVLQSTMPVIPVDSFLRLFGFSAFTQETNNLPNEYPSFKTTTEWGALSYDLSSTLHV